MKVLFVSQWYPTQGQPYFGVFVREHAWAVAAAGHEVQVVALTLHKASGVFRRRISHYTDEKGVMVMQCELYSIFKDFLYHLPFVQEIFLRRALRGLLETHGMPDVVHSHVIYPAGIWGHRIARELNVPHVITEHWSRLRSFASNRYFNLAVQAYQSARCVLPVSEFLRGNLQALVPGLPSERICVTGNVVNPSIFYYQAKAYAHEALTFCAVATWSKKKHPDKMPELFIEALALLQQSEKRKIKLIMIGGGNRLPELRARCLNAGIETLFTGYLPKEEIAVQLREADYFLHASQVETFSIVVAEALACGLPVVCSHVGALPELVSPHDGILCANTVEAWTKALGSAIAHNYDRQAIARRLENRFGPKAIGERISSAYCR